MKKYCKTSEINNNLSKKNSCRSTAFVLSSHVHGDELGAYVLLNFVPLDELDPGNGFWGHPGLNDVPSGFQSPRHVEVHLFTNAKRCRPIKIDYIINYFSVLLFITL